LFKLPRTLGDFEGKTVVAAVGRFGPYIRHDNKFVSIPKGVDPLEISLEEAVQLIENKRLQEKNKHIKSFSEEPEMEVLNGRYGPYIAYKGSNYKIPKTQKPEELTYVACLEIIKKTGEPSAKKTSRGKAATAKKSESSAKTAKAKEKKK
jgi:DNA topoisomerase-1